MTTSSHPLPAAHRSAAARVRRWLTGAIALLCFAGSARGQYDPDWTRHFRVGALVGFNIKADFRMSGQFKVSGPNPGPSGVSGANHFYDDGFVRVDQLNNAQGKTSYWGYDRASQYDAANHALLMHTTTSFDTLGGSSEETASPLPGFELAYGANFWYWGRARIGWDFGFGLLPIRISHQGTLSGSVNQSVYSFDTSGIDQMPPAGYRGGPSGGGSALLHDVATSLGATNIPGGTITGSQTLDVMLYTLRLGPSVYWDFSRYFGMSISAGPALGIVSGDLKLDGQIVANDVSSPFHVKASGTDVVYGGYVNAMVLYHATRNGDIYLGAQYMPLGDATISGQGHEGRLKLKGAIYLTAGINWPF